MRWCIGVLCVLLGCGDVPNPRSCLDGNCTDPSYPFCDVEGKFEGTPGACIAPTCAPEAAVMCRNADEIYVCNATGNNYDIVTCPHGCSDALCNECSMNEHCSVPNEICDLDQRACRGCINGDECESGLCENTMCIPPSQVVYASPNGDTSGSCTRQQPCTLARATSLAVNAPTTPILKLMPGTYSTLLEVRTVTPQPLRIQGEPGVVLSSTSGLLVEDGASVDVRSLEFLRDATGIATQVICGDAPPTDPITTVKLTDVVLNYRAGGGQVITTNRCQLVLSRVDIGFSGASYAMALGSDTTATLDRVAMHPIVGLSDEIHILNMNGDRINFRATNSVFEQVFLNFNTSDEAPPYSQHLIAFNTFVFRTATGSFSAIECRLRSPTDYLWNARVENNIIYAPLDSSAIGGPHCATSKNVVLNMMGAVGTNIVANPQFIDIAARNYGLMSSSPAVDAATPAPDLTTDYDFAGVARPQGAAHDIGAYERQ